MDVGESADADVSEPRKVARVAAKSDDGTTVFLRLLDGEVATANSSSPLDLQVGDVVLVSQWDLTRAPSELWQGASWVGVVKVKLHDVTVIDSAAHWRLVPTNEVSYAIGNTVEASTEMGVLRVLSEQPLRLIERDEIDESTIQKFKEPPPAERPTFDAIGGLDAVVDRAVELVQSHFGHRLADIGIDPIKGILFTGPAGTGKTMLARTLAHRSDATFYNIKGPEIFSKWYGQSEALLRMLFEDARKQRSIVFFDELDSVAGQRSDDSHEASKRVVGQLLTLMDEGGDASNVFVIATTNRPKDIDSALRRPGRLDTQIEFPLPDTGAREDILRKTAVGKIIEGDLPISLVAGSTEGWSGAELVGIWKEAGLLASADERSVIMTEDFVGGWQRAEISRRIGREEA